MIMRRITVAIALITFTSSCSIQSYMRDSDFVAPKAMSTARIDIEASEVEIEVADGSPHLPVGEAELIRAEIAAGMTEMFGGLPATGASVPARFRVKATYERGIWPMFACLIYLTILGCPIAIQRVNVDVDLDIGDKRYSVNASDYALQGLYYNHNEPRPALGGALQVAMKKIAAHGEAEGSR
jgi:hypothetical protein